MKILAILTMMVLAVVFGLAGAILFQICRDCWHVHRALKGLEDLNRRHE